MVDGRVSIYTEGPGDDDAKSCLSTIQNGMSGDALLAAHPAIKGFAYVGTSLPRNVVDDDGLNVNINNDDITPQPEETVWTPSYAASIAAASAILVGSVMFSRYVLRVPVEDDADDSDFDSQNWREVSKSSSLNVSSDDATLPRSNRQIDVELERDQSGHFNDDYDFFPTTRSRGDVLNSSYQDPYEDDSVQVNMDLDAFEPNAMQESDACFDFFDLIIEGTGSNSHNHRNALDDASHLSDISF